MGITADRLIEACMLDVFPQSMATIVDYGLDGDNAQELYVCYKHAIRNGHVTAWQLHQNCNHGSALTKLLRAIPDIPYPDIEVHPMLMDFEPTEPDEDV